MSIRIIIAIFEANLDILKITLTLITLEILNLYLALYILLYIYAISSKNERGFQNISNVHATILLNWEWKA